MRAHINSLADLEVVPSEHRERSIIDQVRDEYLYEPDALPLVLSTLGSIGKGLERDDLAAIYLLMLRPIVLELGEHFSGRLSGLAIWNRHASVALQVEMKDDCNPGVMVIRRRCTKSGVGLRKAVSIDFPGAMNQIRGAILELIDDAVEQYLDDFSIRLLAGLRDPLVAMKRVVEESRLRAAIICMVGPNLLDEHYELLTQLGIAISPEKVNWLLQAKEVIPGLWQSAAEDALIHEAAFASFPRYAKLLSHMGEISPCEGDRIDGLGQAILEGKPLYGHIASTLNIDRRFARTIGRLKRSTLREISPNFLVMLWEHYCSDLDVSFLAQFEEVWVSTYRLQGQCFGLPRLWRLVAQEAMQNGTRWLLERNSPDGVWSSRTERRFRLLESVINELIVESKRNWSTTFDLLGHPTLRRLLRLIDSDCAALVDVDRALRSPSRQPDNAVGVTWKPLFRDRDLDGVRVTHLHSLQDLKREGVTMKHCLGSQHLMQALNGECLYFHLDCEDGEQATLSIHCSTKRDAAPEYGLGSLSGISNAAVSERVRWTARDVVNGLYEMVGHPAFQPRKCIVHQEYAAPDESSRTELEIGIDALLRHLRQTLGKSCPLHDSLLTMMREGRFRAGAA